MCFVCDGSFLKSVDTRKRELLPSGVCVFLVLVLKHFCEHSKVECMIQLTEVSPPGP